ncbi:hypothetical protein [Maribellus sediminis]|uniref:hypothetical protein n=1 Tax=Maribellus sediminis TaxID=2696285 RepID=UPI0014319FE7|nr:hypothetical protein [Maribellus sediminis]
MEKLFVFFIGVLFLTSCTKDNESITYFKFINTTNSDLKIIAPRTDAGHSIVLDSVTVINQGAEAEFFYIEDGENQTSKYPFGKSLIKASIVFNDSVRIDYFYNDTSSRNILIIDNYAGGKVSESTFRYTYTITEEDYNNALLIEN